jgi:hypothetical protein
LVEVYECHEKKNGHRCEFHVKFNDYVGDSKKALDECIVEKLQYLKRYLAANFELWDPYKNESREVELVHHDGCDDSSETTSIFERV